MIGEVLQLLYVYTSITGNNSKTRTLKNSEFKMVIYPRNLRMSLSSSINKPLLHFSLVWFSSAVLSCDRWAVRPEHRNWSFALSSLTGWESVCTPPWSCLRWDDRVRMSSSILSRNMTATQHVCTLRCVDQWITLTVWFLSAPIWGMRASCILVRRLTPAGRNKHPDEYHGRLRGLVSHKCALTCLKNRSAPFM